MAAQGIGPDHPIDHSVNVERLPATLLTMTVPAISAGDLSCYVALNGERWVSRAQLAAVVGFGHKLHDPNDPCFVPPEAMLEVPYLPALVTREVALSSSYQRRVLMTAQYAADYLAALCAAMPPRPFDLHIHRLREDGSPLRSLIKRGAIDAWPTDYGWWVSADEVRAHVPWGDDPDNPDSAWYVSPSDRADHGEVERLCAAHRVHWPELYGTLANRPIAIGHITVNGGLSAALSV
jgi:hypothetical protein